MTLLKTLTGLRFGRLTVLRQETAARSRRPKWVCKCDCGNLAVIGSGALLRSKSNTKSCGCLNLERLRGSATEMGGLRFGKLMVTQRGPNTQTGVVCWECICNCGRVVVVRGTNLRSGATKSCGCVGREKLAILNRNRHARRSSDD